MRLVVLLLLLATSLARADKIAVIDSDRLYEPGGIKRWLAARAQLDAERSEFKVVESPTGKPPREIPEFCKQRPSEDLCKRLKQIEKHTIEDTAWKQRERSVLDPIEAEVTKALQEFAKARRIDILFEKEETMIYVAPSADITDAFIKDFNAKPAPKPGRP